MRGHQTLPEPRVPDERHRVNWLDGVRACAALFVVIHHIWLATFPGFPKNTGPDYLAPLLYGHLAVVVFIVVSGYSLSLAPARNGFFLKGGVRSFAKRRAWRILPPYWAALIVSTVLDIVVLFPGTGRTMTAKAFVVHALLLQDIFGSQTPNGSFWSIAVEAQIYVVFPILLMMRRRWGSWVTLTTVVVGTSLLEVLAHQVSSLARFDHLSPALFVDFAFGMAAADSHRAVAWRGRRIPLLALSFVLIAVGVFVLNRMGSQLAVARYFWVDLVVGALTAVVFRGLATTRRSAARFLLQSRPLVAVGRFSYSIYLVHELALGLLGRFVVRPLHWSPTTTFFSTVALAVPAVLLVSYAFFVPFEQPFLNVRSLDALPAWLTAPVTYARRAGRRRAPDNVVEVSVRSERPDLADDAP